MCLLPLSNFETLLFCIHLSSLLQIRSSLGNSISVMAASTGSMCRNVCRIEILKCKTLLSGDFLFLYRTRIWWMLQANRVARKKQKASSPSLTFMHLETICPHLLSSKYKVLECSTYGSSASCRELEVVVTRYLCLCLHRMNNSNTCSGNVSRPKYIWNALLTPLHFCGQAFLHK